MITKDQSQEPILASTTNYKSEPSGVPESSLELITIQQREKKVALMLVIHILFFRDEQAYIQMTILWAMFKILSILPMVLSTVTRTELWSKVYLYNKANTILFGTWQWLEG